MMEKQIFDIALGQGLGYALFVFLLIYCLKTTGEREKKYQEVIKTLSESLKLIQEVKTDVEEIKHKIFN